MEARLVRTEAFSAAVLKATGSVRNFELGKDVRRAWHELMAISARDGLRWSEAELGYVFIPQRTAEPSEIRDLLVGVRLDEVAEAPVGAELLRVPERTYAAVTVRGGWEQLRQAYAHIEEWMSREGHVRETGEGVYGMEPNRLKPVNPFDLPADTIDRFDYDIMIAVKT